MKLLTKAQIKKLESNFKKNQALAASGESEDFKPVVKLFGGGACTWLLTELEPETGIAFGLCDLGMGFPELGDVSLDELESVKFPPFGLGVERDRHFEADKTLSEYSNLARSESRIVA